MNNNKPRTSNAVKFAFEKAKNSLFDVRKDRYGAITLDIYNASVLWPNFSGIPNKNSRFKSDKRVFNIVLPEVMNLKDGGSITVNDLAAAGWNIRQLPLDYENEGDGVIVYHINVIVNMEHKDRDDKIDTIVKTYDTLNGKANPAKQLLGGEVARLDGDFRDGFIQSADIEVFGCPRYDVEVKSDEPHPCTIYLKRLYAITEPQNTWDDDEKYSAWNNSINVSDEEIIDNYKESK